MHNFQIETQEIIKNFCFWGLGLVFSNRGVFFFLVFSSIPFENVYECISAYLINFFQNILKLYGNTDFEV